MVDETDPLLLTNTPPRTSHLPSLNVRLVQVVCAVVWCLFAAGPVFGFAALKPVLISQGVYKEVCEITSLAAQPCLEQDLKLNKMFTYAAVLTNATALIVGLILDTQGPRITAIIGSVVIFLSALLFGNGANIQIVDAYLLGYMGLAFGGPFVFISSFQLANSFPGNSGLILALLTGAFDSSSALFLLYRIIYQNDYIHDFNLQKFFSWYLIVPVFILVCQLVVMPSESYKTLETIVKIGETGIDEFGLPIDPEDSRYSAEEVLERGRSRRASNMSSVKSVYEDMADEQLKAKSGGVYGVLHSESIVEQYKTPWWYLMCLFTTIQMLRINYFVATIKSQMTYYFNLETATQINNFFDMALPLGGVFSIPFIGLILDNSETLTTLKVLFGVTLTIGFAGISNIEWIQIIGILLLVVYRPFYYTAVSDYCAKVFGFKTFGTVYGTMICFSGMMNVLQTKLDATTHFTFDMNPTPVNMFLVGLTIVFGLLLILFVSKEEKKIQRELVLAEAIARST